MTNSSGTVVGRYDYDPYGRSTKVVNTTLPNYNFTGLYQHAKSGLDMAVYRFYDPDLGRWLSRDPIGEKGGINLYGYSNNDATNQIDLAGLEATISFSISSGSVTGSDSGRGLSFTGAASSGTNNVAQAGQKLGPLPPGQYNIYERPGGMFNQPAYILDPVDSNLGNDSWDNGLGRGAFRFHLEFPDWPLRGSTGCIVMSADTLNDLKHLLDGTAPGPTTTITSPNKDRPPNVWPNLPRLGTLTVTK